MNQHKPKVSIGLPIYNGDDFLEETLDSILAQTFVDFEVIISDNGSTDQTEKICRDYMAKDKRIHYFRNQSNLGAARNYNITFELSSGEYFKWAAHDDLCAPDFFEKCVQILDSQPNVVVCYPRTTLINESGDVQGHYADDLHLSSPEPHKRLQKFFATQGLCHPVFGLIRSSVLKNAALIGNYPMSDRVLLGELALYGEFCELSEYLFLRRIHPQISTHANVTVNQIAAWFDPAKREKAVFPRWRRLVEYLKAIQKAPLSFSDRMQCYLQVVRFAFIPTRWQGLVEDLFRTTKYPQYAFLAILSLLVIFLVLSRKKS